MPRLTEEQLDARRSFLGASDIGAIAGLNPFKDAFDVLNEKMGFQREGDDNEAADWGHRLEPIVRNWYASEQDIVPITPCGTVRHPQRDWMGATLDSKIIGTRRGLEIKIVGHRMVFDWDPNDDEGVPHYVRAQCAWQMAVVDLDEIDVAALLGGTKARVWRIKRDVQLEDRLLTIGDEFWRKSVLGGVAPAITGISSARAYLEQKYPPLPAPVVIGAGPEEETLARALYASRAARDDGEKETRRIQSVLVKLLGEREGTDLVGDGWEFRFRVRKDGTRQPYFKWKGEK